LDSCIIKDISKIGTRGRERERQKGRNLLRSSDVKDDEEVMRRDK
jgi:hypothetical protein